MTVEMVERSHRFAKTEKGDLPIDGSAILVEETPFRMDVARLTSPRTVEVKRLIKSDTVQGVEEDLSIKPRIYEGQEIDGIKFNVGIVGKVIGRSRNLHCKPD